MDKKRLDGWKEISNYLGRDVRTCQRWEGELELPVYRVKQDSIRSKVFSYTTEIDEWFSLTLKNHNDVRKWNGIKKWLVPVLLILIMVFVFFGFFSFVFSRKDHSVSFSDAGSNPVRWDIKGSQIVIYDVQDHFLWTKNINNSTPQESYYFIEQSSSATVLWINKQNNRNKIILEDIDNDSKNEVLCYFNHEDPKERCITLFDNNGQEIWTKYLEFSQEYREGRINNNFRIVMLAFEDVANDDRKEILVLWNHGRQFPSVFLIYDLNGEELFKYIHTGHLQFFVLNSIQEEKRFIYLGGTNNLLDDDAVLSVLDCKDLRNGLGPPYDAPIDLSEQESIRKYIPVEPEKASQRVYIRFKHNEISRMNEVEWLNVLEVRAGESEVFVHVNCGRGSIYPLYFVFDSNFKLKYVGCGTDFKRHYKSIYEEGKVELELEDFLKKCEEDVLFWDGTSWISPSRE